MDAKTMTKRNGSVSETGYIPPSQRLHTQLAETISGTEPGERLPSEPELARTLGVSRATLREAMRTFEGQGVIRRRQGVGTFVVSHTHVMDTGLEMLQSIETLASKIDLDVSMGDLRTKRIRADGELAEIFALDEGVSLVKVTRVISAEERPVAFLTDILPENVLTPDDLEFGFTGSVLDLMLKRGEPSLAYSLAEVRAAAAESGVARALQIQRGDVLLNLVSRLISANGQVVDYSNGFFLPGYFRFNVVRRVESLGRANQDA
jgi:GntR family transcriptional regulator